MNKKLQPIFLTLFILISTIGLFSCEKDNDNPLSLDLIENNATKLYYGSSSGVTIIGGDGNYSFSCESQLLKAEMTHRNYILFEPLGVGEATVTISDSSGKTYLLKVTITYKTEKFVISGIDATVVGDNMTVGDQKDLKEKALATVPVLGGGGYRFVYTASEDSVTTSGIVVIYPKVFDKNGIEGTFERRTAKNDDNGYSYLTYNLHFSNTDRTFILTTYSATSLKSSTSDYYRPIQLAEDLKEQFKTAYPQMEQVYTSQVIGSMAIE